ncbi:hypothetical protein DFH07DRAFT_273062 [Mycena maculata]|uniref:Uncharacterized protein n=1 Tax=Mycena maculata TaxID=230809 RepID=A0AAD7JU43_9AGAR|nr:hypothetical protein DFH07DRAFT_273062 [Mycena maculata]
MSFPQSHFLPFCARSTFPSHLHTLHLYQVAIAKAELLQCLPALPTLERLSISDQLHLEGEVHQPLITDAFLTALTQKTHPACLVPRLHFFDCPSFLQFDDTIYLDCILSRIPPLLAAHTFDCEFWWLPGHKRELDATVLTQLCELSRKKRLLFLFSAAIMPV